MEAEDSYHYFSRPHIVEQTSPVTVVRFGISHLQEYLNWKRLLVDPFSELHLNAPATRNIPIEKVQSSSDPMEKKDR